MNEPRAPSFPDHFSRVAAVYAAHRPRYPDALVEFLARAGPRRELAWDCGCGSGQLSVGLASRFMRVIATDASAEQIAAAEPHPRVEYKRARAEASGLGDTTVDLAVAAQAAHWFDLDGYYAEVRRVARRGAIVALITYFVASIDDKIDPILWRFYAGPLGPHWPPERRHTEDGYRSLPFPFEEIEAPKLEMRMDGNLAQIFGYVETWSAVLSLERAQGRGPIEALRGEFARAWGAEETVRTMRWSLSMRAGRV
jgi:SAM-dependent methyltransferase